VVDGSRSSSSRSFSLSDLETDEKCKEVDECEDGAIVGEL
jgi:hypothetical protein